VIVGPALEAPAVVAGLDDVAVVGQAIEQRGGHFGITEDARPFTEGEVGGDDDRGALVEPADEVEQELPKVEVFILDELCKSLPTPPFTDEEKEDAARKVYQHVWQQAVAGDFAAAA
jgi:hypothetical protein